MNRARSYPLAGRRPKNVKATPRPRGGGAANSGFVPGKLKVIPDHGPILEELYSLLDEHPAVDVLKSHVLKKYDPEDSGTAEIRRKVALEKYFDVESRLRERNGVLAVGRPIPSNEWDFVGILYLAQLKIGRLLPQLRWSSLKRGFAFGPGATRQLPRRHADPFFKLQKVEVSSDAAPLLAAVLSESPGWTKLLRQGRVKVKTCDTGRITTVAKNSQTDRVICVEPSGNMFLQKGAGRLIRKALKRVGVDLDRQEINQEAARYGSIMGNLATVDLSSASDSISYWLVRRLLPSDWFSFLEATRTKRAMLDGRCVKLQKFSAMGNGFTFELESLIFWAIASAVIETLALRDRSLCIYGDDIIINIEAVPLLTAVFEYCGFRLNAEKTYDSGPFRESCGSYWHSGHDVKPFYLHRKLDDHETLFLFHNNLLRWVNTHPECVRNWDGVRNLLGRIRGYAAPEWRSPRLPLTGYGDGAFVCESADECTNKRECGGGHEGWVVPVLSSRPPTFRRNSAWCLLASLYSAERRGPTWLLAPPSPPSGVVYDKARPCVLRIRVLRW